MRTSDMNQVLASLSRGSHSTYINGVFIHYKVEGDGPLIFVVSPGWGIGSGYLQRGFEFLKKNHRVVFIDTRGSGASGRPINESQMGTIDMADDIHALITHLGLAYITLVGHSNGGAIALAFSQKYPTSVKKLLLIDSQLFGFSASEETQRFLVSRADKPEYSHAVSLASELFAGRRKPLSSDEELSEFVTNILPLYLNCPKRNLDIAKKQLLQGELSFYAFKTQSVADNAAKLDQTVLLDRITCPVFIASGLHDWICPVSVAQRLAEGITNSTLVIFDQSGHIPWIEEPEKFWFEVMHFLSI